MVMSSTRTTTTTTTEAPMFKNKLQEYTQKRRLPFPAYRTDNEGSQHAPYFRSTVFVDGAEYTSKLTFRRLKDAEQDAAKLAYECIMCNAQQVDAKPLLSEDQKSNKSILHEYAYKKCLDMPVYKTYLSEGEGKLPVFISTVTVAGKSFTGAGGNSKKDAEQLAANAVFQSLQGTNYGAVPNEMVSLKRKHYETLKRVKFTGYSPNNPRNTSVKETGAVSESKSGTPLLTAPRSSTAGSPLPSCLKRGR